MPKVLSPAQIDGFWKDGYVAPVRAIATDRAALIREKLEAFEEENRWTAEWGAARPQPSAVHLAQRVDPRGTDR